MRYPVVSVKEIRQVFGASPGQNVHRHIDTLVERGLPQHHQIRDQTWRAPDILHTLDRYAGRRRR